MAVDVQREPAGNSQIGTSLTGAALLRVTGAIKHFGGVPALTDASLSVGTGEVVGLLGENGAGKSTLVKALAGIHRLDAGQMEIDGAVYLPHSPRDAHEVGLSVIYQEPSLFPDLSIAENIFVAARPRRRGRVDWRTMRARTRTLLDELDVSLSPDAVARGLSIADQQLVEIAKALSGDVRLLIMDEPTAALSAAEVEQLMRVVRRLRERGTGIVFITHKLDEVFEICDRVVVMRDGATISESAVDGLQVSQIIRDMVGRELVDLYPKAPAAIGGPLLEVDGLTSAGRFADVSLSVHEGEIVALAGLVGSGRSEVANAIFGLLPVTDGSIAFDGERIEASDPPARIARGIAMVPEDRRLQGLFMTSSLVRNATVTVLARLRRAGLALSRSRQRHTAQYWADRLNVKYASIDQPVESLSGGNQQKVVLAKWLATEPRLLIIDEPTRGIDVGTKAEVHRLIGAAVADGLGVLMVSSELPEVLALADRIYVMREGRVVAELARDGVTQEAVIIAATGAET